MPYVRIEACRRQTGSGSYCFSATFGCVCLMFKSGDGRSDQHARLRCKMKVQQIKNSLKTAVVKYHTTLPLSSSFSIVYDDAHDDMRVMSMNNPHKCST